MSAGGGGPAVLLQADPDLPQPAFVLIALTTAGHLPAMDQQHRRFSAIVRIICR
jgi:hypothetical protein